MRSVPLGVVVASFTEAVVMPRLLSASQVIVAILAIAPAVSFGQSRPLTATPQTTLQRTVERAIAEALLANPVTAPYRIAIEPKNGKIVLKGRVGSKAVHDVMVRTAMAFDVPIGDDLIIDSTVMPRGWAPLGNPGPVGRIPASLLGPYTYPPSLFGRLDDPFYGLEPPPILYPPWWGELIAHRLSPSRPSVVPAAATEPTRLPANTVEMTIDPLGVAVIRGTVPTEEDKTIIGQHMLQVEGVTRIINRLTVDPNTPKSSTVPSQAITDDDQPPPPPTPSIIVSKPEVTPPAGIPARPKVSAPPLPGAPANGVGTRIDRAIQARPELNGLGVKVSLRDGIASISGSVPSVFEAMVAYRSVQQTPGVKDVVDAIEFIVPDGGSPNPLLAKGKPDDVEPYLLAQIRRQVGEAAHVDRVRMGGNQLEVQGTLDRVVDKPRVEAILRSMPILRGFSILPDFRAAEG